MAQATPQDEAGIPADLLDNLPDIADESGADAPPPARPPASGTVAFVPVEDAETDPTSKQSQDRLQEVRRQMERVFVQELDRIERSFSTLILDFESRLEGANAELAAARAEHERAQAEKQRKAQTLADLKRSLDRF